MKNPNHSASFVIEPLTLLQDAVEQEHLSILLYGAPGCGKTLLAATAADVPTMQDVLLIDLEKGKRTLHNNKLIKNPGNIDVIKVRVDDQIPQIHKFLKAHCRLRDLKDVDGLRKLQAQFFGMKPEDIKKPRQYNTVIFDSLSELDTMVINGLLGVDNDTDISVLFQDPDDIKVAEFKEYKKNHMIIQQMVRYFRDLPMHNIFTCHSSFVQDERKRMHYSLALTGKLRNIVQGLVDIVGYLQVGKPQEGGGAAARRLSLVPLGNFDAKCRLSEVAESHIDNPTMASVTAKVFKQGA